MFATARKRKKDGLSRKSSIGQTFGVSTKIKRNSASIIMCVVLLPFTRSLSLLSNLSADEVEVDLLSVGLNSALFKLTFSSLPRERRTKTYFDSERNIKTLTRKLHIAAPSLSLN